MKTKSYKKYMVDMLDKICVSSSWLWEQYWLFEYVAKMDANLNINIWDIYRLTHIQNVMSLIKKKHVPLHSVELLVRFTMKYIKTNKLKIVSVV